MMCACFLLHVSLLSGAIGLVAAQRHPLAGQGAMLIPAAAAAAVVGCGVGLVVAGCLERIEK